MGTAERGRAKGDQCAEGEVRQDLQAHVGVPAQGLQDARHHLSQVHVNRTQDQGGTDLLRRLLRGRLRRDVEGQPVAE